MDNVKEYAEEIASELMERPEIKDEGIQVFAEEVSKNNGRIRTGIRFNTKNRINPVIYVDDMYERELPIDSAASEIIEIFTKNQEEIPFSIDEIDEVFNFDACKERIIYKIVNAEKNANMKEQCPHLQFGDLMVVFVILFSQHATVGTATAVINNSMMEAWNITTEELAKVATKNQKRIMPVTITLMSDLLLASPMAQQMSEEDIDAIKNSNPPMFVVRQKLDLYGASVLASKENMHKISEELSSKKLYVLPSSIHELIVIPSKEVEKPGEDSKGKLLELVQYVNETSVLDDEVLSDNVYIYDDKTGTLSDLKYAQEMQFCIA